MKLFNILFLALNRKQLDVHLNDAPLFSGLSGNFTVRYLRLFEPSIVPPSEPRVVFFKGRPSFFFLPASLYRFVRNEKPEVIFISSFIFPFQVLFLRFVISRGTKIIVQHHAERPFLNVFKRWLQKLAYSRADAYLFSAKELGESFLKEGIISHDNKIFEVMESSTIFLKKDKNTVRERLKVPNGDIFLWVGRLNANKDPITVLKAIALYRKFSENFKFYMFFGTAELETEVKKFIADSKLEDKVILMGRVPQKELEDWYNASDYYLSGSHYEGSGYALCEAMACACIPIVTNIHSFRKMTGNGECGILYAAGDPNDLLSKLLSLKEVDHEQLREKIIARFRSDLSFEAIAGKLHRIITDLAQK